jgi:DhnA family fructose-bisphosphate aldolase class Ia
VKARLDRFFGQSGKCLDVALDHGMTNEFSLLGGIEDMRIAVARIVEAGPDAIQLTPGMAHLLDGVRGKRRPALALRGDVSNVYGPALPRHLFSEAMDAAVDLAVVADAACVVVNLLLLPGQPELHNQCVRNVAGLKRECERAGMPLMVEPLVMASNNIQGGYMVDGDLAKITALVRQAVELGADIIKADPCTDPADFHQVIETASGIPVLVRGGGRASDEEILARTAEIMKQGAAGIVYGRNIIQHPHPQRMVRALMALVHSVETSVADALKILEDNDAPERVVEVAGVGVWNGGAHPGRSGKPDCT